MIATSASSDSASRCPSGKAATPTESFVALRMNATSSEAYSIPPSVETHSVPGPPGGSPRSASTLRTPES